MAAELEVRHVLLEDAGRFWDDPYGFVLWAFEWGQGDLADWDGPDEWQREFLVALGEQVRERGFNLRDSVKAIRMAVGSGHGIGKSALVAWLILWVMVTRPHCRISITASTVTQLSTKTQPELAKWHKRFILRDLFEVNTLKISHVDHPETWRGDFLTSRKENSEAFAGQHNAQSTSAYVIDEGSGVPDEIYEVAEGGLTDGEPMIFVFGNRTRPTGYFNDLFTKKKSWWTRCVDSREAKMTNKEQIQEWLEEWGEDSDFFRVRVRGLAPAASAEQFIRADWVAEARKREAVRGAYDELVIGVDVARFGDDESVIVYRAGNDARSIPAKHFQGLDTQGLAEQVNADIVSMRPDMVFIDGGGVGGGVVDAVRRFGHPQVVEVNFGAKAREREWFNKRTEMWGILRRELGRGLAIEDSDELADQLLEQQYAIDRTTRKTRLVSKEDLRRLGIGSPDWGDALALTYAQPVIHVGVDGGFQTQAIMD
jgi:hypothetical protein